MVGSTVIARPTPELQALMKKLHLADRDGLFLRNRITLEKIRNTSLYRDDIIMALQAEKLNLLIEIQRAFDREGGVLYGKPITMVKVGGWWCDLFYSPETFKCEKKTFKVLEHNFSSDYGENYEAGEGEDFLYEVNNDQVNLG